MQSKPKSAGMNVTDAKTRKNKCSWRQKARKLGVTDVKSAGMNVICAKLKSAGINNNYSMSPSWIRSDKITNEHVARVGYNHFISGAIIGDGDRKRAPFLVLGLAPWYGTIFLFLEQIAPSLSTRAYMLRGFLRMTRRRNGVQNSRNLLCFWPQLNAFMSGGILLKYFRRKLLQFWMK